MSGNGTAATVFLSVLALAAGTSVCCTAHCCAQASSPKPSCCPAPPPPPPPASPLPPLNIDPTKITISGISSGADFVVNLHVAHSKTISGVGVFAGQAYHCSVTRFSRDPMVPLNPSVPVCVRRLSTHSPLHRSLSCARVYIPLAMCASTLHYPSPSRRPVLPLLLWTTSCAFRSSM